jgi:hypothetical protein
MNMSLAADAADKFRGRSTGVSRRGEIFGNVNEDTELFHSRTIRRGEQVASPAKKEKMEPLFYVMCVATLNSLPYFRSAAGDSGERAGTCAITPQGKKQVFSPFLVK